MNNKSTDKTNYAPPCKGMGKGMGLLPHYLKIATRNILKYKVQNVVSVVSIAVSAMLFTVVGSFIGEFRMMEILDKPYAEQVVRVRIIAPAETCQMDQWELVKLALEGGLKSAEVVKTVDIDRNICEVTATVDGRERTMQTESHLIEPDFMQWWGVRSRVTGGEVAEIEPGTVILTERMARQLFGRIDVQGEELDVRWLADLTRQHHSMRVADVVHPSPFDPFNYTMGMYTPVGDKKMFSSSVYVQLREGKTKADLDAELAKKLEGTGGVIGTFYFKQERAEIIGPFAYMLMGVIIFLVLFLAVCVVGYMRMQAQLFRIREREIALRTVVGARRWQLYAQFSVEVLIILSLAFALTFALNTLMRSYLTEHIPMLSGEVYAPFTDFTPRTLRSFAVITVACLTTVALVIRSIRRRQTGLAMQLRPARHSFASVATMSVQMFFSTFLTAALVVLFSFVKYQMKWLNVPENDDFYRRCIVLQNIGYKGLEKQQELIDLIEKSGNVERVYLFNDFGDYVQIEDDNSYGEYCLIDFQQERELQDFYGLQPVITNPHANPAKHAYVSAPTMERMKQGGTWERGYIELKSNRYDIAGYFDHLPYQRHPSELHVIATDAERFMGYANRIVIAARPMRYSAALRDIDEAYEQVFPGNLNLDMANYRNHFASDVVMYEVVETLFAIVAAISIVTTMASMYSVISLDTRRRRKEVALRKVHGAKMRDIMRLFARRYVAICSACYLLLLPALLLFFTIPGSETFGIAWWQAWIITAVFMSIITALTIGWRIRDVMHVQPADWLKG